MNLRRLNNDVNRIRQFRNRTEPDLSLGGSLAGVCRDLERQARSTGGVGAAWNLVIPPNLAGTCRIVSLTRGILTIKTADASTRYQLERFLRAGGEAELSRCARTAIRRIKLL